MSNLYCSVREPHVKSKNTFGIPKNESEKSMWEIALGMTLKKSHRICLNHFQESDVISTWSSGEGSSKYTVCLKRYRLKEGAIPIKNCNITTAISNSDEILQLNDTSADSLVTKLLKCEVTSDSNKSAPIAMQDSCDLISPGCSEPKTLP